MTFQLDVRDNGEVVPLTDVASFETGVGAIYVEFDDGETREVVGEVLGGEAR